MYTQIYTTHTCTHIYITHTCTHKHYTYTHIHYTQMHTHIHNTHVYTHIHYTYRHIYITYTHRGKNITLWLIPCIKVTKQGGAQEEHARAQSMWLRFKPGAWKTCQQLGAVLRNDKGPSVFQTMPVNLPALGHPDHIGILRQFRILAWLNYSHKPQAQDGTDWIFMNSGTF